MPNARLQAAFATIKQWMIENDAPLLVENLAPGASDEELATAETKFGFPLPGGLRELWSLHHGQLEEMNGFVESLDLFGCDDALIERKSVEGFVDFLRQNPGDWDEAGVTAREVQSDRWIAFAGRDSDLLLVSAVSGRVFRCCKDAPPLSLMNESIVEWAEDYADRVSNGDYDVEEGFGDYYLQGK